MRIRSFSQRRFFHSSLPRSMPVKCNNVRHWTDQEMQERYRQGREDERTLSGSKSNPELGQYTEDDIKAALEEGLLHANQYVGSVARNVWDEGFSKGKVAGAEDERKLRENLIAESIRQARKEAFEEGQAESFRQAEFKASERISSARNEGFEQGEKAGRLQAEIKMKENIIQEYKNSQKLSFKLKKKFDSFGKKMQKTKQVNIQFSSNLTKNKFASFKEWVGDIPIFPFTSFLYRPKLHPPPTCDVRGWGPPGYRNNTWDSSYRYIYNQMVVDQFRIKDIGNARFINRKQEERWASRLNRKYMLMIILFFSGFESVSFYNRFLYGETREEQSLRKNIEKNCKEINTITPEQLGTTVFTESETQDLLFCQKECPKTLKKYEENKKEMKARRQSGFGDSRYYEKSYFGTASQEYLIGRISKFYQSVANRLKEEKRLATEKSKYTKFREILDAEERKESPTSGNKPT